jgi:hypothetical protein
MKIPSCFFFSHGRKYHTSFFNDGVFLLFDQFKRKFPTSVSYFFPLHLQIEHFLLFILNQSRRYSPIAADRSENSIFYDLTRYETSIKIKQV